MSQPPVIVPHAPRPARILRSTAVVGAMTAVSRVFGLVREAAMADAFGTGLAKSAFNVAFQLPNLFRRLFGEGALSSALVPVFSDVLAREGQEEANRLVARVAGLLIAALGAITAIGILAAGLLQHLLAAPGSRLEMMLPLVQIMLPYAPLICLAALAMGVLNALRSFAISSLAPVFLNLIMIAAVVGLCPLFADDPAVRIRVVAWSVLVAGAAQLAVQVPALRRRGVPLRVLFAWRGDVNLRRVLTLMTPMMFGMAVFQINVFVDSLIALFLAASWAPAALLFAENIAYLPLGLIGNAFGTVLLPTYSRQVAANDHDGLRATVESAMRKTVLITAPAAAGLTVLALPIVQLLYMWPGGKFMQQDAVWTMRALAALAPGLLFFSIQKTLTPAFYALQDTRTPLRIGVWGVGLNLAMNVAFVLTWPEGWKHVGLMVSTVIVSGINSAALGIELHRRLQAPRWTALVRAFGGMLLAAAAMGAAAWWSYGWLLVRLSAAAPLARAARQLAAAHGKLAAAAGMKILPVLALIGAMAVSAVVYVALVGLLCRPAVRETLADFRHRRLPRQSG